MPGIQPPDPAFVKKIPIKKVINFGFGQGLYITGKKKDSKPAYRHAAERA